MKKILSIITASLLVLLCLAGVAMGCSGGFIFEYPRKIIKVQGPAGLEVRELDYSGKRWLIPTPPGLFDLENLTPENLPAQEHFKGLAFSLMPGSVFFTEFSGEGQWPATKVSAEASLHIDHGPAWEYCLALPQEPDLSEAAMQNLLEFLHGQVGSLSPLILEEIDDRVTMDMLLLRNAKPAATPYGPRLALLCVYNMNHGEGLQDSLALNYTYNDGEHSIQLGYSIPLDKRRMDTAGFALQIKELEAHLEWLRENFAQLNGLDLPRATW